MSSAESARHLRAPNEELLHCPGFLKSKIS